MRENNLALRGSLSHSGWEHHIYYSKITNSSIFINIQYDRKNPLDYVLDQTDVEFQSINTKVSKVQNDTLKCTLEEMMFPLGINAQWDFCEKKNTTSCTKKENITRKTQDIDF